MFYFLRLIEIGAVSWVVESLSPQWRRQQKSHTISGMPLDVCITRYQAKVVFFTFSPFSSTLFWTLAFENNVNARFCSSFVSTTENTLLKWNDFAPDFGHRRYTAYAQCRWKPWTMQRRKRFQFLFGGGDGDGWRWMDRNSLIFENGESFVQKIKNNTEAFYWVKWQPRDDETATPSTDECDRCEVRAMRRDWQMPMTHADTKINVW